MNMLQDDRTGSSAPKQISVLNSLGMLEHETTLPSCMCCSQAFMAVVYRIKSGWTLPGLWVKLISEPWSFWWKRRCRFAISHGLFNGDMSLWMRKQTNYHSSVALTVLSLHACRLVSNLWRVYVIWCNMYPLKYRKITRDRGQPRILTQNRPKIQSSIGSFSGILKGRYPPINPIGTVHELGSSMVGLSSVSNRGWDSLSWSNPDLCWTNSWLLLHTSEGKNQQSWKSPSKAIY